MGRISRHCAAIAFATLLCVSTIGYAADEFLPRSWTDRKGNQATATFVDAKNGQVELKTPDGKITKFKLSDFADVEQKYLRDLATYKRKLAAGEKPTVPADPILASLDTQPLQIADAPSAGPARKPLSDLPIRIWTDTSGRKIQAKFMTAYDDKVVVDLKGNPTDLRYSVLSPDDQEYVRVQLSALNRSDLIVALTPPPKPQGVPENGVAAVVPPVNATDAAMADLRRRREAAANGPQPMGEQMASVTPPATPAPIPATPAPAPAVAPSTPTIDPALAEARRKRYEEQRAMAADSAAKAAAVSAPPPKPAPTMPAVAPSIPAYEPPAYTPPTPPSFPSMPTFETQYVQICEGCKNEVPNSLKAGDSCPHCGVFFERDTKGGRATAPSSFSLSGRGMGKLIYFGIAGIVGVVGFIIRKLNGE
ncbi:MAG: hypothetical protein QM811_16105 [Pirellulales bacterium]